MEKPLENKVEEVIKRQKKRLPLWLKWALEILTFLIFTPILLFQIPWIQTKVAHKLTDFFSKEWQTEVAIDKVSLGIFNKIYLGGVYIEDQNCDTLLYAENLTVNHSGIFALPFKRFKIESLKLEDANINIRRAIDQENQNFQFILDYFSKEDPKKKPSKPFHLDLHHLYLKNVRFYKLDEERGEEFDVFVQNVEAHFDRFDLPGKRLELAALEIVSPDVKIRLSPERQAQEDKAPVQLTAEKLPAESLDTNKLVISIRDFDLGKGRFSLYNTRREPVRTTPPNVLNYNYLDIFDLEIQIKDFNFSDLDFDGQIRNISLRDSSGFVLEKLSVQDARLSCLGMELNGLELITPYSHLGDTLVFSYNTYHAFENFEDDVKMDGRLHNANVALRDIMKFAPVLESNTFFKENKEEIVEIEGLIKGSVNRLDGRNLKINLAQGMEIEGSFNTRNLAVQDEQFMYMNLSRLRTHVSTLRKLIPNFKPPENFDRLGWMTFSGIFNGFFVDFVADGRLSTAIGRAEMFMNLKTREGKENAQYSGDLFLKQFDLGAWSGNADLGKVTLVSHVKEGVGLTLNSVNAKLQGTVDSLNFKGYVYKNATLNGQLTRNLFNGDLRIEDNNVNLVFGGEINFTDTLPTFNFEANIQRLALKPLNISDSDLQFFGNIVMQLRGRELSNIIGDARAVNFQVVKNHRDTLKMDTAIISSTIAPETGEKHFSVLSSLGNMDIRGNFDIEKIPNQIAHFIASNYPAFSKKLGIREEEQVLGFTKFSYNIQFFQLQNLFSFFEEKISGFDESVISGSYDSNEKSFSAELEIPSWQFQTVKFTDVYFHSSLKESEGNLVLGVSGTQLGENQKLEPISIIGDLNKDTMEFLLVSNNFIQNLNNIDINGMVSLDKDSAWRISFKPSGLVILNQAWAIDTANHIRIGDGKIETSNFLLSNGAQRIVLKSVREKGLEFQLLNYPIDSLEFIKKIKHHRIGGMGNLHARILDAFSFQGLSSWLNIEDLTINGDNYGSLWLKAAAANLQNPIIGNLSIQRDSMSLTMDGYFNPPGIADKSSQEEPLEFLPEDSLLGLVSLPVLPKKLMDHDEPLYFDFDISIANYPAHIIQYFVEDVHEVKGFVHADCVHAYGFPSSPELEGEAYIRDASFKIDALQTTYRVPDGRIKISSQMFDGSGSWAYDRFGNKAALKGGITHDHLKNFGLDLTISTEPGRGFLGLETKEKDNPVFYGTAIGSGYARFSGSFQQPSLYVNARTMSGTHMFLPMTSTITTREVRFITFTKPSLEPEDDTQAPADLRGLNMEFDLNVTPDAKMEVIFDKAWGDVLQGTGEGELKVTMTREGVFDMNGTYTVATGNYLFTMMNLGLNKPFIVEPGGTISWSGDPYDARINIKAVYEGLSTSIYNFIQEYLIAASSASKESAHNSKPVKLVMKLTDKLLQPNIAFDIEFSDLDPELRNYAESKKRTLDLDPNELNRQVFGLLVLQQFLPSGYSIQAGELGLNTVSEMLSNQLSMYLTAFITNIFTGSNFIQGIDLDISYNRYSPGTTTDPNDPTVAFTTNELRGRLKVIVSDRISIHVGGNFDVGGGSQIYTTNNTLLGQEFQIEYVLTQDRRLKLKVYQRMEPDVGGGRRLKIGGGLSFRKEFDSLNDLMKSWEKIKKKKK